MTDANCRGWNPQHFGNDPADTGIRISPEIRIQISNHFCSEDVSWQLIYNEYFNGLKHLTEKVTARGITDSCSRCGRSRTDILISLYKSSQVK